MDSGDRGKDWLLRDSKYSFHSNRTKADSRAGHAQVSVCRSGKSLGMFLIFFFFLRALLHLINIKLSGQLPSSRDPAVSGVDRVLITSPA